MRSEVPYGPQAARPQSVPIAPAILYTIVLENPRPPVGCGRRIYTCYTNDEYFIIMVYRAYWLE